MPEPPSLSPQTSVKEVVDDDDDEEEEDDDDDYDSKSKEVTLNLYYHYTFI